MRGYAIAPFAKRKGREQAKAQRTDNKAGYARGGAGRSLASDNSFPHPLRSRTPIRNHRRSASGRHSRESQRFSGRNVHPEGKGNGKLPRTGPESIIREVTQSPLSLRERGASKRSDASGVCTGWGREAARSRQQLPSPPPQSNANSKSSTKRQRPSLPAKAGILRGGARAVHAESYRRAIAPNGHAKNPLCRRIQGVLSS